jgi:hypothetical protein
LTVAGRRSYAVLLVAGRGVLERHGIGRGAAGVRCLKGAGRDGRGARSLSAMNLVVRAELEQVEAMALSAAKVDKGYRDEALEHAGAHAAAALATLVHVGLITPEEDREWRERLRPALGDRIRLTRFEIRREGEAANQADPEDQARQAYALCRDASLGQLAWSHHTAATEEAVTEALAAGTREPERIRRACRRGFADRGQMQVAIDDL